MGEKLQFTELDQYLFGQGTHYDVYRKLGAHPEKQGKKEGVYFKYASYGEFVCGGYIHSGKSFIKLLKNETNQIIHN